MRENPETKIQELRHKLRQARTRMTESSSIQDLTDAMDGVLDLLEHAAFVVEVVEGEDCEQVRQV